MTGLSARYTIRRPQVADELIDGEFVVIDFDSGKYHGIRGAGVDIWQSLHWPCTIEQIVRGLLARPGVPEELALKAIVTAFVGELAEQGLIVETTDPALPSEQPPKEGPSAFAAPELESLSDMQDFLALDPIHDVDARGWPAPKT